MLTFTTDTSICGLCKCTQNCQSSPRYWHLWTLHLNMIHPKHEIVVCHTINSVKSSSHTKKKKEKSCRHHTQIVVCHTISSVNNLHHRNPRLWTSHMMSGKYTQCQRDHSVIRSISFMVAPNLMVQSLHMIRYNQNEINGHWKQKNVWMIYL